MLFVSDDLYVMQRPGEGDQSGLIFVLNNRANWNGAWVQTRWNNTRLVPAAWRGRNDISTPQEKWTNESWWAESPGAAAWLCSRCYRCELRTRVENYG